MARKIVIAVTREHDRLIAPPVSLGLKIVTPEGGALVTVMLTMLVALAPVLSDAIPLRR